MKTKTLTNMTTVKKTDERKLYSLATLNQANLRLGLGKNYFQEITPMGTHCLSFGMLNDDDPEAIVSYCKTLGARADLFCYGTVDYETRRRVRRMAQEWLKKYEEEVLFPFYLYFANARNPKDEGTTKFKHPWMFMSATLNNATFFYARWIDWVAASEWGQNKINSEGMQAIIFSIHHWLKFVIVQRLLYAQEDIKGVHKYIIATEEYFKNTYWTPEGFQVPLSPSTVGPMELREVLGQIKNDAFEIIPEKNFDLYLDIANTITYAFHVRYTMKDALRAQSSFPEPKGIKKLNSIIEKVSDFMGYAKYAIYNKDYIPYALRYKLIEKIEEKEKSLPINKPQEK